MIVLPEHFRNKVINRYNDLGEEWLNNINNIIEKYRVKFKLKNIELLNNLTINVVLSAYSEIYGEVIIKLGIPSSTTNNEIKFINNCNSKYIVKCYYYNLEDRIIILERIKPGTPLSIIKDREERIKIFCSIVNDILIDNNTGIIECKNYYDSTMKKFNDEKMKILYNDIITFINNAKNMFYDINNMNLKKYILHHDLHHKNILKFTNGWKVIDPHGVIGYKVFETSQFIKAELEMEDKNINKIHEIILLISKYLKEDIVLIYKAFYIDTVDKIIFYKVSGYNKDIIEYNKNICNEIIKYIN